MVGLRCHIGSLALHLHVVDPRIGSQGLNRHRGGNFLRLRVFVPQFFRLRFAMLRIHGGLALLELASFSSSCRDCGSDGIDGNRWFDDCLLDSLHNWFCIGFLN